MRRDSWQAWKGGRQEALSPILNRVSKRQIPLEVLSEKSDCLVNEKRILASLEGVGKGPLLSPFEKSIFVNEDSWHLEGVGKRASLRIVAYPYNNSNV